MSNLLRKVRLQNLMGGQLPNLLLYVLAEIFFVVVGILVAFQVDNWNEERKTRLEETELLQALKREMSDNATQLKEVITKNDQSRQAAFKLSEIYRGDFRQFKPEVL